MPHAVRLAVDADRTAVAAMLARAFAEDPAMAFIFPDPAVRALHLPRLFALLFDSDGRAGMRLVTARTEAATLWRAPGRASPSWLELLRHAMPLLGALGPALGRGLAVSKAIEANMPPGTFWYLHIAGCEPLQQGKGLGGAAIRAGLNRAGSQPVYLETATESNVPLYQALSFNITCQWSVPKGGPRFWSMLREQ